MSTAAGERGEPQYWIVICPEPRVSGGLWRKWYRERYVAVGWAPLEHCGPPDDRCGPPPEGYPYEGFASHRNWRRMRKYLHAMEHGDKIIPFLLERRIGPVGTIRAKRVTDREWNPSVLKDQYAIGDKACHRLSSVPELGRRIEVEWESEGMPPEWKVARVPKGQVIALVAIRKLSSDSYENLVAILKNAHGWEDLDSQEGADSLLQGASSARLAGF